MGMFFFVGEVKIRWIYPNTANRQINKIRFIKSRLNVYASFVCIENVLFVNNSNFSFNYFLKLFILFKSALAAYNALWYKKRLSLNKISDLILYSINLTIILCFIKSKIVLCWIGMFFCLKILILYI